MACINSNNPVTVSPPNCRQGIPMAAKTTKEIYFRVVNTVTGDLIDFTQNGYILEAFAKTKEGGSSIAEFNNINGLFTALSLPATPDDTTANAMLILSLPSEVEDTLSSYYVDAFITNPEAIVFEHSSFLINIIYK